MDPAIADVIFWVAAEVKTLAYFEIAAAAACAVLDADVDEDEVDN